ncbi:MAG: hypothetical protein ACHQFW_10180, partial [Chitinophagales bacterium]
MGKLISFFKPNPLYFFCFIILVLLFTIQILSGFNGLFGQDSYEYIKILRGYSQKEMPYSVFPAAYPMVGFLVGLLIGNDIFTLQLISMLSLVLAFIYLNKILDFIYKPQEKSKLLYILVFFILSPYILRFSLIAMSDMMNIFLCLGFIYYFFLFRTENELKQLVALSIFGAAAIYTRYASAIILLIPAIIIIQIIIRSGRWKYFLITILPLLILSIPEFLFRHRFLFWNVEAGNSALAYFYVPQQWSLLNFFKKDFYNLDGWQHYDSPNILFVFRNIIHPAFIFCGIIFILFVKRKDIMKQEIYILLSIILIIKKN